MDKVETLQDTDLFGGLDAQVLGEIAEFCEPLHLADGGLLIAEGRPQTPDLYLVVERFLGLEPLTHFKVGMIKAPFFALVIGIIGTYRGFFVESSADAVGRNTTNAVVESIFTVIAVDAVFSIIFTELGW